MDGKPQLKLVIFWKIRLELRGEASAARRDQAKDNVFRPGCKCYSPETTESPQERERFKKCIRFFSLNMRKNFFPLRVVEPWNRLPREAVESPFLEIFKTHLDEFLCILLYVNLLWQGG